MALRSLTHGCCENKYLSACNQFIALAQCIQSHVVNFWIVTNRRRIDCRAALRAKRLWPNNPAFRRLPIFRRFARQKHERPWAGAVGGARYLALSIRDGDV